MDKQRRKELVEQYLSTKPEMGVYDFFCKNTNTHYMGYTQNTKSAINGSTARLNFGNHKIKNLQKDWNEHGKDSFEISVLENLNYDKDDESKTDYTNELGLLLATLTSKYDNVEIIN